MADKGPSHIQELIPSSDAAMKLVNVMIKGKGMGWKRIVALLF
jgi:hypothetical protein